MGNIIIVSLICREHITAAETEEKIRKLLDADFVIEKIAVLNERATQLPIFPGS